MIDGHDAKEIAKAALGVAKDISIVMPELIIVPLMGGFPVYKAAFHALRNNLGISAEEYDPPVIYSFMRYDLFDLKSYDNVVKPHLMKIQKAFGKKKKLMILDEVCSGSSLDYILRNNAQELSEVADEIYVSAIASNNKSSQSWRLEKYDRVRLNRVDCNYVPFTDKEEMIGMKREEGDASHSAKTVFGLSLRDIKSVHAVPCNMESSKLFYSKIAEKLRELNPSS